MKIKEEMKRIIKEIQYKCTHEIEGDYETMNQIYFMCAELLKLLEE